MREHDSALSGNMCRLFTLKSIRSDLRIMPTELASLPTARRSFL
jgi:hypothetical protein